MAATRCSPPVFNLLTSHEEGTMQHQQTELCAPVETPIGRRYVAGHDLTAVAVGRSAAAVEASVRTRLGRPVRHVPSLPEPLARAVAAHLDGSDTGTLHFDLSGLPEFDRSVLRVALAIPRGETRTYGQLAREIGQPRAAQEVGQALGQNPIPLLIPCHRVIYADGRLGGYVFGSRAKQALLLAEGALLLAA
jgi:O-6-methylguanine DNA methyltransferase